MKEWKYLVHFLYTFFYEHIFYKLYIYVQEKNQYYEKQENRRMLINTNLMKEGTMQVPS
jgi:fatty acid desaturase